MGWDEPNEIINMILGILLIIIGVLLAGAQFKLLPFALPAFVNNAISMALIYILAGVGLWLIIDGFMEWDDWPTWPTLIVGLLILAIGVINILANFGVIGFSITFIPPIIYYVLFVVEGILMLSYNIVT